ncbi:MAG TPA: ABC transporter ATP-binding protein [Thermohalobaculum sp.]|nr:ABC transporter ATP-binding protein [Thermohalobaculum sp.]
MTVRDPYIRIEGLTKRFGEVVAVEDIDLAVGRGEFFSLLGASGCGKTTLLRMLAGFEVPTTGEIYIDDAPMAAVAPHHRPTNMVFQNYAIFPHLDVGQNVAYGLRSERLTRAEKKERVEEALAMVKLPGYGSRTADALSGGQQQRIALARALIKRPKVLLLDEPLGALDKKLREQMQLELRALQQSLGITFVFVTHDQEEAMTLSDRIAVMSHGRVLQVASPEDIYQRPASIEVADFLGQMNFVAASVKGLENGHAVLDTAGLGRVRASASAGQPFVREGAELVVAIRPERMSLSPERRGDAPNAVEGVIRNVAYLGDRRHFYVAVEGREEPFAVAAQEAQAPGATAFRESSTVWLSWPDEAVVLLKSD